MSDETATPAQREREVLTPSSLNRLARELLEGALPLVWIEGELSGFSRPASGHLYFMLKDSGAQVRCAMFKPRSTWLRFKPTDGMRVLARARVSLYEPRGEYQLIVEHLEEAGAGALRRAFEELRAKLQAEGLFDATRKRTLPRFPRLIGVITSPSGAAVRDVLAIARRRFALARIEILPVPVQGADAPVAIAAMLRAAARSGRYDVLLLTRGGGTPEDLMAFNDESVARAIAASATPVVSAVGHEVDFSISDFVADLRAPTPSAAAELLLPDASELTQALRRQVQQLTQTLRRELAARMQRLDLARAKLDGQAPQRRLLAGDERLRMLRARLQRGVEAQLTDMRTRLTQDRARLALLHPRRALPVLQRRNAELRRRLAAAWSRIGEREARRLHALARALNAVSPLDVLQRGYAILFDAGGRVLRSTRGVTPGTLLTARLADGELTLRVRAPDTND